MDAITTASRPISGNAYQDYVKVRNEAQGEYARGPAAVSYYVSSEADYARVLAEHPELSGGLALQIGFGAGLVFGAQVVVLP